MCVCMSMCLCMYALPCVCSCPGVSECQIQKGLSNRQLVSHLVWVLRRTTSPLTCWAIPLVPEEFLFTSLASSSIFGRRETFLQWQGDEQAACAYVNNSAPVLHWIIWLTPWITKKRRRRRRGRERGGREGERGETSRTGSRWGTPWEKERNEQESGDRVMRMRRIKMHKWKFHS